jgi:hypothetical protein
MINFAPPLTARIKYFSCLTIYNKICNLCLITVLLSFSNHYLFAQCPAQTINVTGFTYGSAMHGQTMSPTLTPLTFPPGGQIGGTGNFAAANNHNVKVTHMVGGVVQKRFKV